MATLPRRSQRPRAEGVGPTPPREPIRINVADLPWYLPPEMYLRQRVRHENRKRSRRGQIDTIADWITRREGNQPRPLEPSSAATVNLPSETEIPRLTTYWNDLYWPGDLVAGRPSGTPGPPSPMRQALLSWLMQRQ